MTRTEEAKLREIKLATQASLYVDIAAIVVVYVLTLICVKRKWKLGLYLMLGAYLILYSFLVYFGRKPYAEPRLHLDLFWSYKIAFDGFVISNLNYAQQIFQNILLFIPLGLVLTAIFKESSHPILWSIMIGVGLSVATESIQYISRRGITEFDDVIDNGLGLLIGILVFVLTEKLLKWATNRERIKRI